MKKQEIKFDCKRKSILLQTFIIIAEKKILGNKKEIKIQKSAFLIFVHFFLMYTFNISDIYHEKYVHYMI